MALAGIAALVVALPACSAPEEQELFAETRDTLAMNVGETCDLDEANEGLNPPSLKETWIHDQHTACGTGVCIWYGPGETVEPESTNVGTCSCRCDGPEDQGPFCTCPGGFRCEVDVIPDYGTSFDEYTGGYCMPE